MQELAKKRSVIIYLPNGNEVCYTTSKAVAEGSHGQFALVNIIEAEETRVNIGSKNEGVINTESFVGMPYKFEMWT